MLAYTLPVRFRVMHYVSMQDHPVHAHEVYHAICDEYAGEGQMNVMSIQEHLDALHAVGILQDVKVEISENGILRPYYEITQYGRSRLSYLPKAWTKYRKYVGLEV